MTAKLVTSLFPFLEKNLPSWARSIAIKGFYSPGSMKLRPEDKDFMAAAGNTKLDIRGAKTRFYEWGNHDEYVLLIHGWGGRASQMKPMAAKFLKSGYRVVGFDAPGHGESAGKQSSIFHMGQCIMRVMERHGQPKAVIGHSLGAIAGLMSVVNGARPDKLVMISAPTLLDDILYKFRTAIKGSQQVDEWLKDHTLSTFYMEMENVGGTELAKRLDPKQDVLLVHDRYDSQVGMEHPYAVLKHLPQAETYFTKDLGHSRLLRDEEVIDRVIDYVKGIAIPRPSKPEARPLAAN